MTNGKASVSDYFVCHSQPDTDWIARLKLDNADVVVIEPGWLQKFKQGLLSTKVAVFLVSPELFASEFGSYTAVPDLLTTAVRRGVSIQWINVAPMDSDHILTRFSAVNDKPLRTLDADGRAFAVDAITGKLQDALLKWNQFHAAVATSDVSEHDMALIIERIKKLADAAASPQSVLQEIAAELNLIVQHYETADEPTIAEEPTIPESPRRKLEADEDMLLSIPSNNLANLGVSFKEKSTIILGRRSEAIKDQVDIDLSIFGDGTMGISRIHAQIEKQENGDISIRDLKSTNGTWINQGSLSTDEKRVLKEGDLIRLGYLILVVMKIRGKESA